MNPSAITIPLAKYETHIADTPVCVYYFKTQHKLEICEVRTIEDQRLLRPDPDAISGLKMEILEST